MAGDAYQSPSFAWLHALRDAGAAGITVVDALVTSPASAATPKTWLIDNQSRRLVTWSAAGLKTIDIDRGANPRGTVGRLIIPAGHNLQGCSITVQSNVAGFGTPTALFLWSRLRGTVLIEQATTTIHPGVFVLDFIESASRYLSVEIGGKGTLVPQLGELWLTCRETPTDGFEHGYEYDQVPNVASATLPSGAIATLERGPLRRTLKADTWRITGGDRRLYDRMIADCGGPLRPVWIDSTFGFYETPIDDMESSPHTTWSVTNGTASTASGVKFAGASSLAIAVAGGVTPVATRDFTNTDLRRCILKLAVQAQSSIAFLGATTGIRIRLSTNGASANASSWYFGSDIVTSVGVFSMLSIDLSNEAPTQVDGNGCDLSSIGRIAVTFVTPSAQNLYIDDVHYLDKRAEPWCARIVEAGPWKQGSQVPRAGEAYSRSIEFLESVG